MIRVAVLLGGSSSERAVSLRSGAIVIKNLPRSRFIVKTYDPGKKTGLVHFIRDAQAKRFDVIFNALHGTHGEDGRIQGLFEMLGVPYTGSGILASAHAMDKAVAKRIFKDAGIPLAKDVLITKQEWTQHQKQSLARIKRVGPRIVVKPNALGSSVGLKVNPKRKDWVKAINKGMREDGTSCLIERYVQGREFTVPVLETKGIPEALPVVEIRTASGVFDYHAKYHDKRTQEITPAPIPASATRQAQRFAVAAHRALGCKGYSRTDMMMDDKGRLFILETNTLPGLTTASLLPKSAAAAGISYPELLSHLIREALR